MSEKARMGQPTIFFPKNPKNRKQGLMTDYGSKKFEAARQRLKRLTRMKKVGDADVFDYLARGLNELTDDEVRAAIAAQ